MEERMGFGRMTALSALTALATGAAGVYAMAPAIAGQEKPDRKVIVQVPDDGKDRGGRVIVRKIQDAGPGFDVFAMGGARVGM
jgi:hypothetical protein